MIEGLNDRMSGNRSISDYLRAQQAHAVSIAGHTEQQFLDAMGMRPPQQRLDALFYYHLALYAKVDMLIRQGKTVFMTYIQSGVNNWVAEYVLMQRNAMPYVPIRLILFLPKPGQQQHTSADLMLIRQADRRIIVNARKEEELQRRLARWSSLAISIQFQSSQAQYAVLATKMGTEAETVRPQDLMRSIQGSW